jgi:hypothetical protein
MTTHRPLVSLAVALAGALAAGRAQAADIFSPGELSKAHQSLEGLESCTKCHVAGQQLAPARCLECHVELRTRVQEKRGFHGRLPATERECQTCHHEHQGRDVVLVDWGPGGQKGFDHTRTGFELKGKHRTLDCARCHDPRRITDPVVLTTLQKQPDRKTFLGQPKTCEACHFDEHRGQLGADCQRCHTEDAWKPARGFDHARTAYPLTGRHVRVDCAKCHLPQEQAAEGVPSTVTPPVNPARYLKYKGVTFQQCTDCHKDPHQDRFGPECSKCHTTDDWKRVKGQMGQRAFHDKTRFPLKGAHAAASCAACHGPFAGEPAKYRGLAFARCTDCHADAHLGQMKALARAGGGEGRTCDRCHSEESFVPARFELEDHDQTTFKLVGAHRTVACALCHVKDPKLAARVPVVVKADLERQKRPLRVSLARFEPANPNDCRACHRDPHAGQFDRRVQAEGCTACHVTSTFKEVHFDHAKDSLFALTGKHTEVACASCHRPDAGGVVRYRPLNFACAGCHTDPHVGQFASRGQGTDCSRCHDTRGFKDLTKFVHGPPFTRFTLTGKHQKLDCQKCHPVVQVAGMPVRKYRPLATHCQGCHEDFHKGAFRGFVP